MAFDPGYSTEEAAKGAEAFTKIITQPDVQARIKAESSQAQSQAAVEQMKAEGQKAFMEAEKKALETSTGKGMGDIYGKPSEVDPAVATGESAYGNLQLSQELQQRKQALQQEERNIKLLAPEDRTHLENTIQRMQKDIDTTETKLLNQHQKYLGEEFSLLDSVHDDASLQGARQYAARGIGALADKAIADKKMAPENKEAFIRDNLDKLLPETFDAAGKSMLETKKNGLLSVQDQIKEKRELSEARKAEAANLRAENEGKRIAAIQEKQLASGDKQRIKESLDATKGVIQDNRRAIKEYEDKAEQSESEAGSLKEFDKPEAARKKKLAEDYRGYARDLEQTNKPLVDTLKATGEKLLPEQFKPTPKPTTKETPSGKLVNFGELQKQVESSGWKWEPSKYEYRVGPNGKVQRALRE